jgi:hypothetical protein
MILSKEAILAANDLKPQEVSVPEWGGSVLVASMTGEARDEWEQSLVSKVNGKAETNLANIRARLVAATVVDEAGKRLFTAQDVTALGKKSAAALERVCKVAQKLNGLGDSDLEDLKGN